MNTSFTLDSINIKREGDDFIVINSHSLFLVPGTSFSNVNMIIFFVRRGRILCNINSRDSIMKPGNLVIIPPGQDLTVVETDKENEVDIISVSPRFLDDVDSGDYFRFVGSGKYMCKIIHPDAVDIFSSYMELSNTILLSGSSDYSAIIHELSLITTAFFYKLSRIMSKESGGYIYKGFPELTSSFLVLLDGNFRSHRDLEWYAGKLCKSIKYLSRQIKTESGRNASWWIEKRVIKEARSLLLNSSMSISQMSEHLGFPSQSFFGRYFRRLTGLSPVQFRKRHFYHSGDDN